MVRTPVANGQSSSSGHGAEHWPNPGTPMTQQNSWWMDVYSPKICYLKKKTNDRFWPMDKMVGFVYLCHLSRGQIPLLSESSDIVDPHATPRWTEVAQVSKHDFQICLTSCPCLMECHMFPHDFDQHSFTRTNKSANKPPVWTNIHTTPTRTLGNLGMVNSSYG